jgi:hypothetical protein
VERVQCVHCKSVLSIHRGRSISCSKAVRVLYGCTKCIHNITLLLYRVYIILYCSRVYSRVLVLGEDSACTRTTGYAYLYLPTYCAACVIGAKTATADVKIDPQKMSYNNNTFRNSCEENRRATPIYYTHHHGVRRRRVN